jgi:hypothetical protein
MAATNVRVLTLNYIVILMYIYKLFRLRACFTPVGACAALICFHWLSYRQECRFPNILLSLNQALLQHSLGVTFPKWPPTGAHGIWIKTQWEYHSAREIECHPYCYDIRKRHNHKFFLRVVSRAGFPWRSI